MKKIIPILAIITFAIFHTTAQDISKLNYVEIDSILNLYDEYPKDYPTGVKLSLQVCQKALNSAGKEDSLYAEYLSWVAYYYELSSDVNQTTHYYKKSNGVFKKVLGKNALRYASGLNWYAVFCGDIGRYEEAEFLYKEILAIQKNNLPPMHPKLATTINNLALLYNNIGKYEQAELLYKESSAIVKAALGEDHEYYVSSLGNLALLYSNTGKYEEAEALYKEIMERNKKLYSADHPESLRILNNLGGLYKVMGKYAEAELFLLEGLAKKKAYYGDQHPEYASTLNNLGSMYLEMKQYEKAKSLTLKALAIRKKNFGVQSPSYIESLYNFSSLYLRMNQLDTALAYSLAALAANSDAFNLVFPDLFLSKDSTDLYAPEFCCNKITSIDFKKLTQLNFRSLKQINPTFKVLLGITKARYEQAEENSDAKKALLLQHFQASHAAMEINERIRNSFLESSDKLRNLTQNISFVTHGIEAALKLNSPEYLAEAFTFSEQNKSMLLTDAIKGTQAQLLGDLPDSLVLLELKLQKQKEEIQKQKHQAKTPENKAVIANQENTLNLQIDAFLSMIKEKYPKYHDLKYKNILAKSSDIQGLLDNKTIFLEYFVTQNMTYLFALTNQTLELFPITISKDSLNADIGIMRKLLSDYSYIIKNESTCYELFTRKSLMLYQRLVEIALKNKKLENIIIVADGELGHIPFEVLLMKTASQEYQGYADLDFLIKNYNISYNYSATLWKEVMSKPKSQNSHQVLACAGAYGSTDYLRDPSDSSLLEIREQFDFDTRKHLQPLPSAEGEIDKLSTLFQGAFLKNTDANERKFKEIASEYGVIHLAMHGILHTRIPILSSLAFTEDGDSTENNFLQAYEIAHLKLNADLVVLSACETGYGKFEQGEGVISLARSFMYAGVPSLIVSLWQVNDASTAAVMEYFYKNLKQGLAKDVALRQAKLEYLQNVSGIASHPAFWSAFIQLGDSRPIIIASRTNWGFWLIGGGLVILLVAGVVYWRKKEI